MTDANAENTTNTQENTWHYTLLALAVLALVGSILWLFFVEMSFEPLLGVLVGVGGIIAYRRNASRFIDSTVAVTLIIFFLVCAIWILRSSESTSPAFVPPNMWSKWILAINIIAAILILILITLIIHWSLSSVEQSRVARLTAWALSGKAEESVLRSFADASTKVLFSIVVWAAIVASVWILAVLLITFLAVVLDVQVSGTMESLTQYGFIGGIAGACFGLILAIIRLKHR